MAGPVKNDRPSMLERINELLITLSEFEPQKLPSRMKADLDLLNALEGMIRKSLPAGQVQPVARAIPKGRLSEVQKLLTGAQTPQLGQASARAPAPSKAAPKTLGHPSSDAASRTDAVLNALNELQKRLKEESV